MGRPRLYDTPEELDAKATEYFTVCENNGKPPTISGLAYFLGFTSRQSLYDYKKEDKFSYTIKRLRLRIESVYEENLHNNQKTSGAIFALKNLGWTDRQELSISDDIKGVEIKIKK